MRAVVFVVAALVLWRRARIGFALGLLFLLEMFGFARTGKEEVEGVVGGLDPGLHFFLHAAGQIADVASGGHDDARDEHLFILSHLDLLEGGADAEEGLAGAGLAVNGDEGDGRIVERVEEEALAEVGGLEAASASDVDVFVVQLDEFTAVDVPGGNAVGGFLFIT